MTPCNEASDSNAVVDGLGMESERERSRGTSSSMASLSGVGAIGARSGKVRLWSCLV